MNVALLGYGKMGKEIEKILLEREHKVVARIRGEFPIEQLTDCDVAIDFSSPSAVLHHIRWCMENKIPLVVGTTGWHDEVDTVQQWINDNNGSLIYASNFSIGVHLFRQANELLAKTLGRRKDYGVKLLEAHHTEKLDAPSGTAISIAEDIIKAVPGLTKWENTKDPEPHTLGIVAERIPDETGTHSVTYASDIDEITLTHKAHSRKGFALGAVVASEWIVNHKGLYGIGDMLKN